MKQVSIGRFTAGSVGMGMMRIAGLDIKDAERAVMTAVDNGVTLIDHADIYGGGKSEEVFGEVLRRNPELRGRIVLQDKVGICRGYYDASKEHILEAADGCLKRLGVDHIDALLLHRPDALMEPDEVAEAFVTLREAGKVDVFGVSNQNVGQMAMLNKAVPGIVAVNQLQFSLCHTILVDEGVNVNLHSAHGTLQAGGVLDYCRLNDIRVQAWSPFQYGFIEKPFIGSDKYPELNKVLDELAEKYGTTANGIAIAWILRHPAGIQPIVGSMNPERIAATAKAADIVLTRQEWYKLYLAAGNPLP